VDTTSAASNSEQAMGSNYHNDVSSGQRFEFGKNWQHFLSVLDEERILVAERSLQKMLGVASLDGKSFLDIGSGSGLFSLAAMRSGAHRVHSFDYDPESVACTRELKRRYFQMRRDGLSTRPTFWMINICRNWDSGTSSTRGVCSTIRVICGMRSTTSLDL